MLRLDNVVTYYGPIMALKGVSLEVRKGEIVCLLGGNASGKSTTMKTILGIVRPRSGTVELDGVRLDGRQTGDIVRRGISLVPEARRIFGRMTVWENLVIGSYARRAEPQAELDRDMQRVFGLFPRLRERQTQYAGTLSGGEQQMLAIGRALMARPRLVLMDEPSMGLSPLLVQEVFEIIARLNRELGISILLVEQNAHMALKAASYGYVMEQGRIVLDGTAEALRGNEDVKEFYLGKGGAERRSFRNLKSYKRRKRWI
jgi:branched-chain amino acid transport system ATP-binding protein